MTEIKGNPGANNLVQTLTEKGISHEKAFGRHIEYSGRQGTLLDLLTLWMYSRCGALVKPDSDVASSALCFMLADMPSPHQSPDFEYFVLPPNIYEQVVPRDLIKRYMARIYDATRSDGSHRVEAKYLLEQLAGCRYACLPMIHKDTRLSEQFQRLCELYRTDMSGDELIDEFHIHHPNQLPLWTSLKAVQSGFMYVEATRPDNPDEKSVSGFISVGCCYNYLGTDAFDNPIVILTAALPPGCGNDDAKSVYELLRSQLESDQLRRSVRVLTSGKQFDLPQQLRDYEYLPSLLAQRNLTVAHIGDAQNAISQKLHAESSIHPFPKWVNGIILWLMVITEFLREEIHEGNPLGFALAVGERSQIQDSGLVEVLDLALHMDLPLLPFSDDGKWSGGVDEIKPELRRIIRQITKKNYAWFQQGKYALLWDAMFPSRYPISLIRLRHSSWDVYTDHLRTRTPHAIESAITAFIYTRSDGSGGVAVGGEQLLSFRRGQSWAYGHSRHEAVVRRFLESWLNNVGGKDGIDMLQVVDLLSSSIIAIAENPHVGCMLVITQDAELFDEMGDPWIPRHDNRINKMTVNELTALMCMDGATCLDLTTMTIKFRRLVVSPEVPQYLVAPEHRYAYLDGEGSRKWSAARAALHEKTRGVICVSQDGPILVFERDKDSPTLIRVTDLSTHYSPYVKRNSPQTVTDTTR
jgi:hypothetical protein